MSFNPYQNYGAGIAALGPVQAMSDRNDVQTYMANGGQMFASGGIARLAEGGDTALPKYKYDPVTQQYVLQGKDEAATAMEAELLKKKKAAEAAGGGGSSTPQGPSEWSQRTSGERAAYYADRPFEAALARGAQTIFGNTLPGAASQFFTPDAWHSSYAEKLGFDPKDTSFGRGAGSLFGLFGRGLEAVPKAGADVYGYAPVGFGGYGTTGIGSATGIGVGSSEGINSMDAQSDSVSAAAAASEGVGSVGNAESMSPGGGYFAHGGLAALASGGITGSGNLDLHIPLDLGGGGGGGGGGYTAAGAGGQYGFNGRNNTGGGGFGTSIDPQGIMSDTFKGTSAFSGNPTEAINSLFNVLGGKATAQGDSGGAPLAHVLQPGTTAYNNAIANKPSGSGGSFANGGMARGGMSHLGDYSDGGRLLRGPGDGVSDSIPATIGDKRPARLADGEFVVPARIVSELGNGSTEAGARKLYAMMDRIQKARGKTVGKNRVAVNSRADKNLPA